MADELTHLAAGVSCNISRVHTFTLLAQGRNPILPDANRGWTVSMILLIVVLVAAILVARYLIGTRRSADVAARRAAGAEAGVRALREDLRRDSL